MHRIFPAVAVIALIAGCSSTPLILDQQSE